MPKQVATFALIAAVGLMCFSGQARAQTDRLFRFSDAPLKADRARLPVFRSSDPALDAFWNAYFMRHLSVDASGVYWGTGPMLGATDHLWVIEWDQWMLPWIDRAAMGRERQSGSDVDVILTTLSRCSVDKYGYVFGAFLTHEPNNSLGGYKPTFGWPWPKYNRNYTVTRPTGWEFNAPDDASHEGWTAKDIQLDARQGDFRLHGLIAGKEPRLVSPLFDCDVFQIPIVEVDIEYRSSSGKDVRELVDGLRLYWTTADEPEFAEERSVGVSFSALPPRDYPDDYAEMAGSGFARYPLFFPMYLHPKWGRQGRTVTRLMLAPCRDPGSGVEVALNFVRATYDVRMATTNAALINAAARFYLWSGNPEFLGRVMPRLRRAMLFLNEHLRGRAEALICQDWFVGHDGRGGDEPGHGMIGSYWDLLPSGRYDLESSCAYYLALKNMAALEEACRRHSISIPTVSVIGPDSRARLTYGETEATLRSHAERVRRRIEKAFWSTATGRFVRNIDADGGMHDYGCVHLNLAALAWGIGTPAQRLSILSWLDGRPVPGDASIGADIYRWRFAPRTSTRRNTDYYFWPWIWDWRNEVGSPFRAWGDQMQDGGALPATSLWEAMARCGTDDAGQVRRALMRARAVAEWYADITAAGGDGSQFCRAYYDGHPERGKQQSPMPGGLGLDREFLSDASLGTIVPFMAFLGVDTAAEGILTVRPSVPGDLDFVEVANIHYRGQLLTIRADHQGLSVYGVSDPQRQCRLRLLLPLRDSQATVTVNGAPVRHIRTGGRAEVAIPLENVDVRWTAGNTGSASPRSSEGESARPGRS